MAQNSLSREKSSQSLEVNWDVWMLTVESSSFESVEGVSQAHGPWGVSTPPLLFLMILEVAWLLFCLPPQGCRGILQCEITHNTLTSSSSKMMVLSGSGRPRPPPPHRHPPSLTRFQSLFYRAALVLRDRTDNHSFFPPLCRCSGVRSRVRSASGPLWLAPLTSG